METYFSSNKMLCLRKDTYFHSQEKKENDIQNFNFENIPVL